MIEGCNNMCSKRFEVAEKRQQSLWNDAVVDRLSGTVRCRIRCAICGVVSLWQKVCKCMRMHENAWENVMHKAPSRFFWLVIHSDSLQIVELNWILKRISNRNSIMTLEKRHTKWTSRPPWPGRELLAKSTYRFSKLKVAEKSIDRSNIWGDLLSGSLR